MLPEFLVHYYYMKVVRIDALQPDPAVMNETAKLLRRGGVIIYPSDTCYGLGADPANQRAKQRIARMKQRDESKKFSVIAKDIAMIESVVILNDEQRAILHYYLPGQFTFVLLAANLHLLQSNSIGVRIPYHPFTSYLSHVFDKPFISTSANLSGHPAIYSYDEIQHNFLQLLDPDDLPDLVLDAGALPVNPPSTVVDLVQKPPAIIRQGAARFRWPVE